MTCVASAAVTRVIVRGRGEGRRLHAVPYVQVMGPTEGWGPHKTPTPAASQIKQFAVACDGAQHV